MAMYTNNAEQNVNTNGAFAFTDAPVPCKCGLVRHRDGDGNFQLSGSTGNCRCPFNSAEYLVTFNANVSLPEGGTTGPIQVGLALDGTVLPSSIMEVPGVVGTYNNISRTTYIQVWNNCCQQLSVVNMSSQQILAKNSGIVIVPENN